MCDGKVTLIRLHLIIGVEARESNTKQLWLNVKLVEDATVAPVCTAVSRREDIRKNQM